MVLSVVDLPAPFAPIRRDDFALLDAERDALQRVDRAVVDVEVFDVK